MADDIQVEFENGYLWLRCGEQSFIRLRDVVMSEAKLSAMPDDQWQAIRIIDITVPRPFTPPSRLRDRVALFGCATFAFVLITLVVAGVCAITGCLR